MKKILLAITLVVVLTLSNAAAFANTGDAAGVSGDKFTDISRHWARDSINKVADQGNFSDKQGRFLPNNAITRSEFVLMLHKALGIKIAYFKATDINEFFSDVKNSDIYASALYDLVISNIIDTKDKFKPSEVLNRAEMVHYIINSLEYKTDGNYAMIKIMPEPFRDDVEIIAAYKYDFVKAQILKLVLGRGDRMFYPLSGTTRAEAATVIDRLLKLLDSFKQGESKVQVTPMVKMGAGTIEMTLAITNNSDRTVTLSHTSGQKYDFALLDSEKKDLYRWSADKSFIALMTSTEIGSGETVEYKESITGELYTSLKDKVRYMMAYIIGDSKDFTVNGEGYAATLQ